MRARVQHHAEDAELLSPGQLVDQCVDRFLPQRVVGRAQVQQIGRVGDDRADAGGSLCFEPALDLFRCGRLLLPPVLILGEDLHRVGADGLRPLEREAQAAGNGHVGAE